MAQRKLNASRFIFELLIVFVGVYGAFLLSGYEQTRRDDKIKINYLKSFRSELVFVRSNVEQIKEITDTRISAFETALNNGEKPNPEPFNLYLSTSLLITQAGLNDDIFMQLDSGLASSLSGGFDNVMGVRKQIEAFNDLCNDNLISPNPITFYSRSGLLLPQFDWYLAGLKRISRSLGSILEIIDQGAMPSTNELIESLE